MRVKYCGPWSMTVGQLRFSNGDEADLPAKEAREILRQWPNQFKLVRSDKNKMMHTARDK